MGNLHSAASAMEHVAPDATVLVTSDASEISRADRVIFPGVGAVRDCMAEIRRLGFDQLIKDQVATGKPVLGICVGMQVLLSRSHENNGVDCIDIFSGQVEHFGQPLLDRDGTALKVPHMGWNQVFQSQSHPLWADINDGERFYFVHSYCVQVSAAHEELGRCHYGRDFSAAIVRGNLAAVQFHPEKSHNAGLQLLRNFSQWQGA
jgi:glutamine amidotransferase